MTRRRKKVVLTPEEEKAQREHVALWLMTNARMVAGHIRNGTLDGCTMRISVLKDKLDLDLNVAEGKDLVGDGVVSFNYAVGGITFHQPEPKYLDDVTIIKEKLGL